jgi:hypothetical protein
VRVFVNDRQVDTVTGERLARPLVLTQLPAGRFVVRLTVLTTGGRLLSAGRTYRACVPARGELMAFLTPLR